jgi:hypothetical protein
MIPRSIPHVRFTLAVASTVAAVTLLCATDTAEPLRTALAVMAPRIPDARELAAYARGDGEGVAGDQDLDLVKREEREYAQALRARIDALANTAFAVDADDGASDDFVAWRDLKSRQEHLEAKLASIRTVTPDEWPLLRENLDQELLGVGRVTRTASRMPTVTPR